MGLRVRAAKSGTRNLPWTGPGMSVLRLRITCERHVQPRTALRGRGAGGRKCPHRQLALEDALGTLVRGGS